VQHYLQIENINVLQKIVIIKFFRLTFLFKFSLVWGPGKINLFMKG
jgi:hypothetical protein